MKCPKCETQMVMDYNFFKCPSCELSITNRIAVCWEIEDVLTQAEERGIKLDAMDCAAILELVEDKYDASVGINWDVIDTWTDYYLENKKN